MAMQESAEARNVGLQPDGRAERDERKGCETFVAGAGAVGLKPARQVKGTS